MELQWTVRALSDLKRLHTFMAQVNRPAASRIVRDLVAAPDKLRDQPRRGLRLSEYDPREVRRIIVRHYELRYEIVGTTIYVLRLWHARERR